MVNMKTSLAAQRTETFEEQGFKNIFVKVFFTKTYFPSKITIKLNHYHFSQKNTLVYPQKPSLCDKQALTIVKIINLNINTQQRCP